MDIAIGVAVSILVQFLKNYLGTETMGTLLVVLIVSLFGAVFYVYVSPTDFWPTFVQIVTVAGGFYAYILQRFETK